MTEINPENGLVTLINVFAVAPSDQQKLIDLLIDATEQVMRNQPGYVSANLHKSDDGTKVVNYAQWRTRADFQAMLRNESAGEHMRRAAALASIEPQLYEVVYSDQF